MTSAILVINAGSSSIKFSVYRLGPHDVLSLSCKGQLEAIGVDPSFEAHAPDGTALVTEKWPAAQPTAAHLRRLLDWIETHLDGATLTAAGHRVVHGGREFAGPVLVDDAILAKLDTLVPLAPLHQPHNLAAIRDLAAAHPTLPQIACFDTSFHRSNDRLSTLYALPRSLIDEGVQRYGFHGLSYEFIARRLKALNPALAAGRVVACHLGNGASMCAMYNGKSIASSMGFTALEGLPMGTRSGQIDPGVLLYLLQEKKMTAAVVESLLYKQSGLLGLSGVSSDLRVLAASDNPHAAEAIAYFIDRIGRELGSLAAALGGIDGLVFTAGIGEHSVDVRARVVRQAAWLGFQLDEQANAASKEGPISPAGAPRATWVIPTDEELMIASHSLDILKEKVSPQ